MEATGMASNRNSVGSQREPAIRHLMEQTHQDRDTIEPIYDAEVEALERQAKINQFLSLIASKRVIQQLSKDRH
jgi:hypothetical protein